MPLSRGPSHRALDWVRGHSSKTSSSSNGSKRQVEPDIVHLGGSRVGLGYSHGHLELPVPETSQTGERPVTQWNFGGPLPSQTGIGIAVDSADGHSQGYTGALDRDDNDRPVTQWFTVPPALGPAEQKSEKQQRGRQGNVDERASNESGPHKLSPFSTSAAEAVEESLLSPRTPVSSSTRATSQASQASSISPLPSPSTSATDVADTKPAPKTASFPKRSTSLSQASRHAPPPLSQRAIVPTEGISLRAKEVHLRRTQSNAEGTGTERVRRRSPMQQQPAQPMVQEEETADMEADAQTPETEAEIGLELTHAISPLSDEVTIHQAQEFVVGGTRRQTGWSPDPQQQQQSLPPLTSPPPAGPLPPIIPSTKLAGHGKIRGQPQSQPQPQAPRHRRDMSDATGQSTNRAERGRAEREREAEKQNPSPEPESDPSDQTDESQKKKLTSKERYWLHRQYRGEANFLRAWGLDISNAEDRQEGMVIMRELMEGEAREENNSNDSLEITRQDDTHTHRHQHHSSGSVSGVGLGLGVITEERAKQTQAQAPIVSFSVKRPPSDKHSRAESENSVLGAYLDLRLSHI